MHYLLNFALAHQIKLHRYNYMVLCRPIEGFKNINRVENVHVSLMYTMIQFLN